MARAFAEAETLDRGPGAVKLKVEAWARFLQQFSERDPYSDEDDRMRADAEATQGPGRRRSLQPPPRRRRRPRRLPRPPPATAKAAAVIATPTWRRVKMEFVAVPAGVRDGLAGGQSR